MPLCAFRGRKGGLSAPVRLFDPLRMSTAHQSCHNAPPKALACFFLVLRAANEWEARFYHQKAPANAEAWVGRAPARSIQNTPV